MFVRRGFWNSTLDRIVLWLLRLVGFFYLRCGLCVHFHGRGKLWAYRHRGYFLYANHTQAVGDPFIAALAPLGARPYAIVSTANYGIPVLGVLMPWVGALPVLPTREGMSRLSAAVHEHNRCGHPVVIYPEAHVWDYYTGIRPFGAASFCYPVDLQAPSFAMTTVYIKQRRNRPRIDVYIDGPFWPEEGLPPRERRQRLCETIRHALENRAAQSNCEYIRYEKRNV